MQRVATILDLLTKCEDKANEILVDLLVGRLVGS